MGDEIGNSDVSSLCQNDIYENSPRIASSGNSLRKESELEVVLNDWFRQQERLGNHVTLSTLRQIASHISKKLGKSFSPTKNWICRWKQHRQSLKTKLPSSSKYKRVQNTVKDNILPQSISKAITRI